MFVLIWLIVSLPTNNDASGWGREHCQAYDYCVTLNENIGAEAGLCAVIPCSFMSGFEAKVIIWYKCVHAFKREDCHIVFQSDKNNEDVQPEFKGRVSLLEPDVNQRNCSIMINDLRKSDSGYYQLRVVGEGSGNSWTYTAKTYLSLTDLNQKPKVTIPLLTEGQQATLTCTAPGLCSGSPPKITWMWSRKGEEDSHITGNTTSLNTENLTTLTQRHSSTLTFNPSAEHHNSKITCKVSFTGDKTTEETATLNVTYTRKPHIYGRTTVMEGDDVNLTCSVDSFPPSVIQWTKLETKTNLQRSISSDSSNSTEDILKGYHGNGSFSITNVTAEDAGLYICTVKHLTKDLEEEIRVTVTYKRKPQILGNATVKEGDLLNLTCSVDSFPPSVINWPRYEIETLLMNVSFPIINVTAEDAVGYICTATYMNSTLEEEINIRVTYKRRHQIDENPLNLTCSVDSFPPSFIKWNKHSPILNTKNRTILSNSAGSANLVIFNMTVEDSARYICTTTYMNKTVDEYVDIEVTYHIVNSTLTVRNHGNISVQCTSSNENGEVKKNLIVHQDLSEEVNHVKDCGSGYGALPWVIAGVSLSVTVFCMICMWHLWNTRKKMKPTEVAQTYMSLQKADTAPEYDVIDQRPH